MACAAALRSGGYQDAITLLEAGGNPHDRPPLSKEYLAGERTREGLSLQAPEWFADNAIELVEGRAQHLDPDAGRVTLTDGRTFPGDHIVLATGATPSRPAIPGATGATGATAARVLVLRDLADADRLRAALTPGARLLVVGGGLLGSEVAATALGHGVEVTLVDPLDPPHADALGPDLARWLHEQHREHGVSTLATSVRALDVTDGGIRAHLTGSQRSVEVDVVLLAVGIRPDTTIASSAGIEVDDGILVDESQRTSHPRVLAVGDAARRRGRARTQHWDAARLAGQAAARTILGLEPSAPAAPWFWSDRYGRHIEVVGSMTPTSTTQIAMRGRLGDDRFSVWHLRGGLVEGAGSVDDPNEVRAARRLIERAIPVSPQRLTDPGSDLRALVRG